MKKYPLLKILMIAQLLVSTTLMAQEKKELQYEIQECGIYNAFGVAEKTKDEFFLTFFKGSKSEIRIQILDSSNMKLLPYLDKEVVVNFEISKLPDYRKGEASILSISDSTLTAIHVEDRQGFVPIKKSNCLIKSK